MRLFTQITRNLLYLLAILLLLPACSYYSKARKQSVSAVAVTAGQKDLYKSMKGLSRQPLVRLGLYLDAANTARLQLAANPSDTLARSDYNFAIARIMEVIDEAGLTPWDRPVSCESAEKGNWSLGLNYKPLQVSGGRTPADYQMLPTDRYDFKGKLVGERVIKEGLGAPIVVVAKNINFKKVKIGTEKKQMFYGLTATIRFDGQKCVIQLIDPLSTENTSLDNHSYPLAADFQAPLSLALAELNLKKAELSGLLSPSKNNGAARLARLQPYNAEKTPVLFIHGLGNSPATWAPMIDYLRNDAAIRKRYQLWFFSYPTGLPYPMNAAVLRTQLDEMKKRYPKHKDIIIVAHSLGGNITRLLVTDTGMKVWDKYYAKDPGEIPFSDKTRKLMSEALIFKARPGIARVIFASASLRGSNDATNFMGRLGVKLIGNPFSKDQNTEEALAYVRPEIQQKGRKHLPNSVEILNPDNMFLNLINSLPIKPGIPYHTLIGDRGKGGNLDHTEPVSSDGIVPYWSSHLDGAVSEKVIPSEHWSILHPMGMAEVKRILLKY